jgi:hypothetical protein
VTGEVSSTVLSWIFPDHVGETTGRFGVDLHVRGRFPSPTWDGAVDVRDVFFREKKLGRDLRLPSGTVALHDWDVLVGCPQGTPEGTNCRSVIARVDDTGDLRVDGGIGLKGSVFAPQLRSIALRIDGENLEWGSAGVFSLGLSPHVDLTGTGDQLRLAGRLDLVTGRYYQNFDVKGLVFRPRTVETEPPFYEGYPLLEDLELDVVAGSTGPLLIRDNLADLNVTLPRLHITGTLASPTLSGSINVEPGGRFAIPFLRAEFLSDRGEIAFERHKTFPTETPRLDLHASADWTDRYDQIHHIILNVRGTYREPDLDLSSTDGWDKARVLTALFMGGTTDDLRRAAQESATGAGHGPSGISDGALKSLSGQLLGQIEDPLQAVTRFDLVRLELGYDSVLIKLCWLNRPAVKVCGTGDVGFVSTSRYDGRAEFKISDTLSFIGSLERIQHDVDTIQDDLTRGRLQLTLKHPIY